MHTHNTSTYYIHQFLLMTRTMGKTTEAMPFRSRNRPLMMPCWFGSGLSSILTVRGILYPLLCLLGSFFENHQ